MAKITLTESEQVALDVIVLLQMVNILPQNSYDTIEKSEVQEPSPEEKITYKVSKYSTMLGKQVIMFVWQSYDNRKCACTITLRLYEQELERSTRRTWRAEDIEIKGYHSMGRKF